MKKKDELSHDVDVLCKDLALEQDKLTSTLFTLVSCLTSKWIHNLWKSVLIIYKVSRENRYASSFLEMMRIKKQFYENAYNLINAELPYIERILSETKQRPVFGWALNMKFYNHNYKILLIENNFFMQWTFRGSSESHRKIYCLSNSFISEILEIEWAKWRGSFQNIIQTNQAGQGWMKNIFFSFFYKLILNEIFHLRWKLILTPTSQ